MAEINICYYIIGQFADMTVFADTKCLQTAGFPVLMFQAVITF